MVKWTIAAAAAVILATGTGTATAQQAPASPRDTSRVSVGGATVLVDYGRPYARGRKIMGGLVPFDAVWRTGANAATTLVTDRNLMFGSVMVPPGTYTLYTIPGEQSWKLIINRQTGQWGTSYDAAQDLARVDMKVEALAEPVEQFTISLAPKGSLGELRLAWEKTAAVIPFMVH